MPLNQSRISLASSGHVGKQARTKQSRSRGYRLESSHLRALYFVPVEAPHPERGNLASLLAKVQIRSPIYLYAGIRQVDAAFGVMGKPRKEFVAHRNHLVGLLAFPGNPA